MQQAKPAAAASQPHKDTASKALAAVPAVGPAAAAPVASVSIMHRFLRKVIHPALLASASGACGALNLHHSYPLTHCGFCVIGAAQLVTITIVEISFP